MTYRTINKIKNITKHEAVFTFINWWSKPDIKRLNKYTLKKIWKFM